VAHERISGERSPFVRGSAIEETEGAHLDRERRDLQNTQAQSNDAAPLGVGLAHAKSAAAAPGALLACIAEARSRFAKQLSGDEPFDAASYAAVTGISVDRAKSEQLNHLIKEVAARIGLDHEVAFATETKYLGHSFEYSFLGLFQGWDRPKQPIVVGVGLLAKSVEDIELLYRFFNREKGAPPALMPMFKDFLELDVEQRIEAILVHEKHELEAVKWGSSNPHRAAVFEAPETEHTISPRVRRHLELYAECQEQHDAGGRR
jgi:hypothetical protein